MGTFIQAIFYFIFLSILILLSTQLLIPLYFVRLLSRQPCRLKKLTKAQRTFLIPGIAISPLLMFGFSIFVFAAEYRADKGNGWFYLIHDGWAGATLAPLYIFATIILVVSLVDDTFRRNSQLTVLAAATLGGISTWYTFATLALNLPNLDGDPVTGILALIPFTACLNYAGYLVWLRVTGDFSFPNVLVLGSWLSVFFVSLLAKIPLAKHLLISLPKEPPDCFVVTAAARGHPAFVGSFYDPQRQRLATRQLLRLQRFEHLWATRLPRLHRLARCFYNYLGPRLAGRIHNAYVADFAYLCLKPVEGFALISLRIFVHQ